MHDLLEGVFQTNFLHLFDYLKDSIHSIKLTDVAKLVQKFSYGRHDGQNKVPHYLFIKDFKFKMSASKMWTFVRIFPMLIGEKLKSDQRYLNFLKLIRIFRLLIQDAYKETHIQEIEKQIDDYLSEYKFLYENANITAKQHFLVHYGRHIRNFGPLK